LDLNASDETLKKVKMQRIRVVGLGPGPLDQVTMAAWRALTQA
jgi:siroheme synthase